MRAVTGCPTKFDRASGPVCIAVSSFIRESRWHNSLRDRQLFSGDQLRLVQIPPEEGKETTSVGHRFRLYDDNGEPMKWVKSLSLKVQGTKPEVIMTVERYVVSTDEIDVEIPFEAVNTINCGPVFPLSEKT